MHSTNCQSFLVFFFTFVRTLKYFFLECYKSCICYGYLLKFSLEATFCNSRIDMDIINKKIALMLCLFNAIFSIIKVTVYLVFKY